MIGGWKYERRNSVRDGVCCRTRGSLERILEVPRERDSWRGKRGSGAASLYAAGEV